MTKPTNVSATACGAGEAVVLTVTVSIDSAGVAHTCIQTHESKFPEAVSALYKIRDEIDHQIANRDRCPASRSTPLPPALAAPQDDKIRETIATLRNPGPIARQFSGFLNETADLIERLAAPQDNPQEKGVG